VDRLAAEPVIYLVGGELIGGFLRTNQEKGDEENLNSAGMAFRKLCMTDLKMLDEDPDEVSKAAHDSVLELVYGSIAQISALAAGRELAGVH
jgi:glutamate--cysteine ligase